MEFTIEQEALATAMTTASRALGSRMITNAALAGIHLSVTDNDLTMVCTDRDLTVTVQTSVQAVSNGEMLLPGRLAVEVVRSLEPGAVIVKKTGDSEVELRSGVSHFTIRSLEPDLFPRSDVPGSHTVSLEIPAHDLASSLGKVVRAASTDDSRAILTGVLVAPREGGFTLVATDSYRLAIATMSVPDVDTVMDVPIIIPGRALSEMRKILSTVSSDAFSENSADGVVRFTPLPSAAQFTYRNISITTRLVDGRFPDYERLVPTSYLHELSFDAVAIQHGLKRMKLLVQDQKTPTRLIIAPDVLTLAVTADEIGSATEQLPITYDGEPFEIAFNASFLSDGIDALDSETVILKTSDSGKPSLLLSPSSHEFEYLLMPIRVV